jgi:hypothetical protein
LVRERSGVDDYAKDFMAMNEAKANERSQRVMALDD